ncbi:MAG: hypothetical protein HQL80_00755 [Magnetococcales bacterium]|nr:hypothetical protein [Magnetococcales bacterium]MBF0582741.1 hypothetical protein [Magnetococcales bacterium]
MNETNLHTATVGCFPPPAWNCDAKALFPENDEEPFTEADPTALPLAMDGIASRGHFGNSLMHDTDEETAKSPLASNVRPGSSLRLSLWGLRAAKVVGQPSPLPQSDELIFRRSNALVRRYTQWHTVQPQ